jgi:hypothetical protein
VIVLNEDFHLGPIAPADPQRRTAWFRAALLPRYYAAPFVHRFWRQVVAEECPVVWACQRSAKEWCGFMELAWRRRRPFLHIDVAHLRRPQALLFDR